MSKPSRAPKLLLLSVTLTLALYYLIPYGRVIAYPLVLLSTIAHELGHGAGALLSGGGFHELLISANGSGVAVTSSTWWLTKIMTLVGGLIGPSVVAALGFKLSRSAAGAQRALRGAGLLLGLACLLWVRSLFGLLFLGGLALLMFEVPRRVSAGLAQFTSLFLSTQLALSVFSRGDYLFTRYADLGGGRVMPSDVAQLEQLTWLPYWLWGLGCGALSLMILAWGLKSSLPTDPR